MGVPCFTAEPQLLFPAGCNSISIAAAAAPSSPATPPTAPAAVLPPAFVAPIVPLPLLPTHPPNLTADKKAPIPMESVIPGGIGWLKATVTVPTDAHVLDLAFIDSADQHVSTVSEQELLAVGGYCAGIIWTLPSSTFWAV